MTFAFLLSSLLLFCRVAIVLVFLLSFVRKVRDISSFQYAISAFHLLPARLHKGAALALLGGEGAIVLCLVMGGPLLLPGFVLASLLLLLFSGALLTVLLRRLTTSCNCFGFSERQVSLIDIWRNGAFLLCASGGALLLFLGSMQAAIGLLEGLMSGVCAMLFVVFFLQLHEIVQVFQ